MSNTFEDRLTQIDDVIKDMSGHYYIKDTESRLLYANQPLLDFINCGEKKDLIGTTAFIDIKKMTPIHLSPRRREVLFYALKGMPSKDIAEHLGLSKRTVENNLATIKERNAHSTTAEMIRCIRAL